MISMIVTRVPVTKPMMPNMLMRIFLINFHLQKPRSSRYTSVSRMGGKIKASVDEARAPTNEIIRSKCGMIAASPTGSTEKWD